MAHLELKIGVSRHQGMERDYQEDDFSVRPDLLKSKTVEVDWQHLSPSPWGTLLAVADGMGGMNAGEIASELAIKGVEDYFEQLSKTELPTNSGDLLRQSIYHANQHLVEYAKAYPESKNMGTTIVLAWLFESELYVAWSGDSRCYRLRDAQIQQLNHDHSYVQELIDKGKLTVEQAFYHPNKNVVTQSLGDTSQHLKPDSERYALQPKDRFLLCSDGLNTMLTDEEIGQILLEEPDVMLCAKALVDAANAAGGHDNITVIVCDACSDAVSSVQSSVSSKIPSVKVVSTPKKSPFLTMKPFWMSFVVAAIAILGFWGWKIGTKETPLEVADRTNPIAPKEPEQVAPIKNSGDVTPHSPVVTKPKHENKPPVTVNPKPLAKPPSSEAAPTGGTQETATSSESQAQLFKKFFEDLPDKHKGIQMDFINNNKTACECLNELKEIHSEAKNLYTKYCTGSNDGSMIDLPKKSTDFYISLAATKDANLESDKNRLKKK